MTNLKTKNRAITLLEKDERQKKVKSVEYPDYPRTQSALDFLRQNKKKSFTLYSLSLALRVDNSHLHKRLKMLIHDGYVRKFLCPTCNSEHSILYQAI